MFIDRPRWRLQQQLRYQLETSGLKKIRPALLIPSTEKSGPNATEHEKGIIIAYLRGDSINEIVREHPTSPASIARLRRTFGITKRKPAQTGQLGHVLDCLQLFSNSQYSFHEWHQRMKDRLRKIRGLSDSSLRRSLNGDLGWGTALIISPPGNPNQVLVGHDHTVPSLLTGRSLGSLTVPATRSEDFKKEDVRTRIRRVLEQEALSDLVLTRQLPEIEVPPNFTPIAYIKVANFIVEVVSITLPPSLEEHLSSPKLSDLGFRDIAEITQTESGNGSGVVIRAGVIDMLRAYQGFGLRGLDSSPESPIISRFNLALHPPATIRQPQTIYSAQ